MDLFLGFSFLRSFCFGGLSQKLMALKKAYADIILNTAKESATRIMVSEGKAQRFQREVQAGKDEALRMLLRLKQMMDSKVNILIIGYFPKSFSSLFSSVLSMFYFYS